MSPSRDFTLVSQRLELEVDFATQSLRGITEIVISPQSKELRSIRLNGRQCRITFLTVEGKAATLKQQDPYTAARSHPSYTVHQHHLLRTKVEPQLKVPPEEEINIILPKSLQIKEVDPFSIAAQDALSRSRVSGGNDLAETPLTGFPGEQAVQLANLHIVIKWEVIESRDGLQWIGFHPEDSRYPHAYTRISPFPGTACSIFPCVDDPTARCPWEISIKVPRTLGDAFPSKQLSADGGEEKLSDDIGFSDQERALEIAVVCSGNMEEAEVRVMTSSKILN